MSLLDSYTEEYIIMEKRRTPDGEGGYTVSWSDGASISMALRFDSSMQAQRAMQEGVTSVYTFLAKKGCGLDYHDVLKRKSDGSIFRLTGKPEELKTPSLSALNYTAFTAERWKLT